MHSTLARLNKKKFVIEQIETKYKRSTLESQFHPARESYLYTPSAGVMLTEYYFSVSPPTPDAQTAQSSTFFRRPYNQAIQNLEVWKCQFKFIGTKKGNGKSKPALTKGRRMNRNQRLTLLLGQCLHQHQQNPWNPNESQC